MRELHLADHCLLREDGTVFPPVTPDVPAPPGYASPLDDAHVLEDLAALQDGNRESEARTPEGD